MTPRVVVAAALVLTACSRGRPAPDERDEPSTAASPAGSATRTADCRSFEGLDLAGLEPLPASPYKRNFDKVWRTVLEKHYDPTLGCLDWPQLREVYGAKVAAAKDEAEAFALMNEMLDQLGQSHLRVVPPYREPAGAAVEGVGGPARVPIEVVLIKDRAYVSASGPEVGGSEEAAVRVPTGARLLRVGETAVDDAIAAGRHTGGRPVERKLHARRAVEALLRCPEGGTHEVTFADPASDDAARTVAVPCYMPEGERVTLGNLRDLPTRVTWRMIDDDHGDDHQGRIGYLAFNYWMVPMVAQVRRGVSELRAQGMRALVLDLRGNPGGVGAMSIPVARLFLDEAGDLGTLRMRGMSNEFKVQPGEDPFLGPVVVLVDEGTASTSEIFAVGMRDMGRIEVVGASSSAGLALPSLMETLPDGGLMQYVVGDYRSPKGTVAEGQGVEPDVRVQIERADLIAGRDPVLDAAVAHLRERGLE